MGVRTTTWVFVAGMLVSGVCNTILNKFQDMQCVENCNDPDSSKRQYYEQPVWQTLVMFMGETLCFVVFYVQALWDSHRDRRNSALAVADRNSRTTDQNQRTAVTYGTVTIQDEYPGATQELSGWRVLLMWLPTACDICGTTLMNVGLIYTAASVYQMLRGAVVLFTGAFSVFFLNHRLLPCHWFSLFLVVLGVSIVGLSSVLFPAAHPSETDEGLSDAALASLGVFFVLCAQIFTATQFVLEERIMERYHVSPMRAVGLEGVFGVVTTSVGMVVLHFTIGRSHPGGFFDLSAGWRQIIGQQSILLSSFAIACSIAFFNYFGLAVTKTISATSRSTIDTSRIVFIWIVSLFLGWEVFALLQVAGFGVLVLGTLMFNNVIDPSSWFGARNEQPRSVRQERQRLVVPEDS